MKPLLERAPEARAVYSPRNGLRLEELSRAGDTTVLLVCSICGKDTPRLQRQVSNTAHFRCRGCRFVTPPGETIAASPFERELLAPGDAAKWVYSHTRLTWLCGAHGEWLASPLQRTQGRRCPQCYGRRQTTREASLGVLFPEVAVEWSSRNSLRPEDVSSGAQLQAWWRCSLGHEWEARVSSRTRTAPTGCPTCVRAATSSRFETEVVTALREMLPGKRLRVRDRRLIAPQELDVLLEEPLRAIELNGDWWHSDRVLRERHGLSAETYHRRKRASVRRLGGELAFLWESSWRANRGRMLSELKGFLATGRLTPELELLTSPVR